MQTSDYAIGDLAYITHDLHLDRPEVESHQIALGTLVEIRSVMFDDQDEDGVSYKVGMPDGSIPPNVHGGTREDYPSVYETELTKPVFAPGGKPSLTEVEEYLNE